MPALWRQGGRRIDTPAVPNSEGASAARCRANAWAAIGVTRAKEGDGIGAASPSPCRPRHTLAPVTHAPSAVPRSVIILLCGPGRAHGRAPTAAERGESTTNGPCKSRCSRRARSLGPGPLPSGPPLPRASCLNGAPLLLAHKAAVAISGGERALDLIWGGPSASVADAALANKALALTHNSSPGR